MKLIAKSFYEARSNMHPYDNHQYRYFYFRRFQAPSSKPLPVSELDKIISGGLNSFSWIKKRMKKMKLLSMEYKRKLAKAGEWCEQNKDVYPTNWLVSVEDIEKPDLTHIVIKRCALCALCQSEGVPFFTPSLCATDYLVMSFADAKLERPTILSNGGSCCDNYITRN